MTYVAIVFTTASRLASIDHQTCGTKLAECKGFGHPEEEQRTGQLDQANLLPGSYGSPVTMSLV